MWRHLNISPPRRNPTPSHSSSINPQLSLPQHFIRALLVPRYFKRRKDKVQSITEPRDQLWTEGGEGQSLALHMEIYQ